ncbi:hypothetical protein PRUB_a4074 [Pseudoalteromonas rubra]|uniref:Mu-like prophage FluMu N-terminal domain-containing protein n=1 Tax=Pseudoalteromonas rubra TaxID=43658 RepID=A0A8T0C921_9GAMM|nr:HI1506-related protein [Pseudoalteromonas rubra]KAF7787196.1 hypothetical protein PRUB_a4074 [Pseudoalteromonas rubra]
MANQPIQHVCIVSQQPDGYRRAGITLTRGENKHQVTESQLEALKADSRLTVQIVSADEGANATPHLEPGSMGSTIKLDLSNAPDELAHIIAAIHELKPSKKPTLDELAFEVDGVDGEQKPTAQQRDDAWSWYQAHIVSAE